MINERIERILNEQISKEFYSAYMYLGMSCYFIHEGLEGFQHWLKIQAKEECKHAMMITEYLIARDGKVSFAALEMPPKDRDCPLCAMEYALNHEKSVTQSINDIYDLADAENDKATMNFIDWFIDEQVEEEASFKKIITKLQKAGDNQSGWLLIDQELAERKYECNCGCNCGCHD